MLNRIGILIYTKLVGHVVGHDQYGNRYYNRVIKGQERRWVMYNGISEPTNLPPKWFSWLHFLMDVSANPADIEHFTKEESQKICKKTITSVENLPSVAVRCYRSWAPNEKEE